MPSLGYNPGGGGPAPSPEELKTGDIIASGATSRDGCLLCDGAEYSRTVKGNLFAAIGTTYGSGDGSTTFNVPNLVDKFAIGAGATAALGQPVGAPDFTVPAHTHVITDTINTVPVSTSTGDQNVIRADSVFAGSTDANNAVAVPLIPPALGVNYFIKD